MNRKQFLLMSSSLVGISENLFGGSIVRPEEHFFKDDGIVPNNKLPLLLYKNVFDQRNDDGATWLEQKFLSNNWYNSWRNGIFTFQHYHSLAHEVLGIYSGDVLVLLGGDKGKKVEVKAGTIIIIPAGVGHKNLGDHNLGVVGAYPDGMAVDILRAEPGDRPKADENISKIPLPKADPFSGAAITSWK